MNYELYINVNNFDLTDYFQLWFDFKGDLRIST